MMMNPMMQQMMMNPMMQQMMNQMNMQTNPNMMNQDNITMMNTNYYEYKIIHKNPLDEQYLNKKQINLSLLFNGITNFNKKIYKNGNKILLNYYNLEKIEIYVDFDMKVKEIISLIFGCIFVPSKDFNISINYKRIKEDQNTQYIASFPLIFYKDAFNRISKKTIYLEYKNKNLLELSNKTGIEIGLKNGEEILLKLDDNYLAQLITLPLDGTYLELDVDGILLSFPTFDGELTEEFKKRLSYIFNDNIIYHSLPIPCILRNKFICKNENYGRISLPCYNNVNGGGVPIDFVDVSKGKIKELKFSRSASAPEWRKVQKGLNIFGICDNPDCKAHKREVIFTPNPKNEKNIFIFNLNDNIINIKCPICYSIIKLKTCGFWKCEYQFIGQKIEKGRLEDFNSIPKETKDNEFEYFNPSDNGNVTWTKLIIYAIPKQKIKYKLNLK